VNSRGLIREFVLRGLGIGLLDPALIASEQKKDLYSSVAKDRRAALILLPNLSSQQTATESHGSSQENHPVPKKQGLVP
jgi:hypothetical protein